LSKKEGFQEILKGVESIMPSISDLETKKVLNKLLNLVETIHHENEELKEANQQLKDEVSHLKGEQGKPDIKSNKPKDDGDIRNGKMVVMTMRAKKRKSVNVSQNYLK
jgi:FtsZ-binding cell division protein ZapB